MEQDDIIPLNPPFGTDMWKLTAEPLMVPCIEPFPIMLLPASTKLIVPLTLLPFCVTVQVIFSWPVLSADVPDQLPATLVRLPDGLGLGEIGDEELPPHAATRRPTKTKA